MCVCVCVDVDVDVFRRVRKNVNGVRGVQSLESR